LALAVSPAAADFGQDLELPPEAIAFSFGPGNLTGFKAVRQDTAFGPGSEFGFTVASGMEQGGKDFPDPLSGSHVRWSSGKQRKFVAKVPNGDYLVWLCGGKVLLQNVRTNHLNFRLALNERVIYDEKPTLEEYNGDQYLHRFVWNGSSRRAHATWNDYIAKMYPVTIQRTAVTNGQVEVIAKNFFLSALILVPAAQEADFDELVARIRQKRIGFFERTHQKPIQTHDTGLAAPPPAGGECVVYVPVVPHASGLRDLQRSVCPWTVPSAADRKRVKIQAAGARGERVVLQVAVAPYNDLGESELVLSDLKGPGTIPAARIKGYLHNFGQSGGLLPLRRMEVEAGSTISFYLLLQVPDDAKPGRYQGKFTFAPGRGRPVEVPVEFEVYPFALLDPLPLSMGMWGIGPVPGFLEGEAKVKYLTDRFERLRQEVGFTSIELDPPFITAVDAQKGTATIACDPATYLAAKKAGLGACPEQMLLIANMYAAAGRALNSVSGESPESPQYKKYFTDAMRQFHEFYTKLGVPVLVIAVDEPREVGKEAWHQGFRSTRAHLQMCHQVPGMVAGLTLMGDGSGGHLVSDCDVVSTHAWEESKKIIRDTLQLNKRLWFFNSGLDRYTWGFYSWKMMCTGCWQWHFYWSQDPAHTGGYPGEEFDNMWTRSREYGYCLPGPYNDPRFKGGIIFERPLLEAGEGITDYAYVLTLEKALKQEYRDEKAKVADEAKKFLVDLRNAIPKFSDIRGLAPGSTGADVGLGMNEYACEHVENWRNTITGFLKKLSE
jgi:hypothetical protein